MFLDEYEQIPFKVLTYTAGHINYGGRVTDDWDRRCMMSILADFYSESALKEDHSYDASGVYHVLKPDECTQHNYIEYILDLPINDTTEVFCLHANANITFAQTESYTLLESLVTLESAGGGAGGVNKEAIVGEQVESLSAQIPAPWKFDDILEKYPVMYEESMNTVLQQEVVRYNGLLDQIGMTLSSLTKAIKGTVVMDDKLQGMFDSIYDNKIPDLWAGKAYPSLMPLSSWVLDLLERIKFIQAWIDVGIPSVFWISGFFFPQAFLTGSLQNYARRNTISIDTISFDFEVLKPSWTTLKELPEAGVYIRGLFVEAARWDYDTMLLGESKPKELYTDMATIWLKPKENRPKSEDGFYMCPIYKTLNRAGTLSTTGHSTNFVIAVELPTDKPQSHWVKGGVALFCALNY
jgi:dynein heavy chain